MKTLTLVFVLFYTMVAHADVRTVPYVDLQKYAGTWFEIGSIPQIFQLGCKCTYAQYGVRADGDIDVKNTCFRNGKERSVSGRARVIDKQSNAKIQVRFGMPFYLPTRSGNYWVIGLDSQYRYSVVSNRDGSTLWILSRTRELDPVLLDEAMKIAESNGLDLSKLELGTQEGCEAQEIY